MMIEVDHIIDCLEKTPLILSGLVEQIPPAKYRERRIKDKWSIHEQVCHLIEAQQVLTGRFKQFSTETTPHISAYEPPVDREPDFYLQQNMFEALAAFPHLRSGMVQMLREYDQAYWMKTGTHDIYQPYSSKILLTHALNVDYAHLFSIEQLGLTKDAYVDNIMTIP